MLNTSHILVVNPGSTSTKIAVFNREARIESETFEHSPHQLQEYPAIWDQFTFRLELCRTWAADRLNQCDAVAARGGLLRPLPGGVYRVNGPMLNDARNNCQGEHASNLGCVLAAELAAVHGCEAFVVDPVSVDEFSPLAFYSGHPAIRRKSLSHALSLHAAARRAAAELGLSPDRAAFVIAHIGGGISVAPVLNGRIIDANDAASDGPFSPERSGGLPLQPLVSLCYSRPEREIRSMVMGKGGLTAYLGTNSVKDIERRIEGGDRTAEEVFEAMAYQISKEIGAMAAVLHGRVHAVILTGGCANSRRLMAWIEERVRFIAPVLVYPGDDEMQMLASAVGRALCGEERVHEYGE